jgi:hypothetical protein
LRAGRARGRGGLVFGTVIDHEERGAREGGGVFAHDRADPERFIQARDENGERRRGHFEDKILTPPLGTIFHAAERRFWAVECLLLWWLTQPTCLS